MIRVSCKPRTRPQTKGSGVAPPTVGSRQARPAPARRGAASSAPSARNLFPHGGLGRRSAIRTRGPPTHPLPNPPREGFFFCFLGVFFFAGRTAEEKGEALLGVFGVYWWKGPRL